MDLLEVIEYNSRCSDTDSMTDGYHTFEELYEHRLLLFCLVLKQCQGGRSDIKQLETFKSRLHDDGASWDGWFVAGIKLNDKWITYHLPIRLWDLCCARELERAPEWDGHTSSDVLERITQYLTTSL